MFNPIPNSNIKSHPNRLVSVSERQQKKDKFCLCLYLTGASLNKGTCNPSPFTPETNKLSDDNCVHGG
jgi:hypothetical protein